ncbi:MAG TPA: protein kinase [bacterium]|nr:protein kinase [bacterium]
MEQRIGKYRIIKLLGAGAFAEVFLAEDPVTGRKVAIKRCTAEGARRDSLLAECRLLVQLEHPHIVTVFDANLLPPYFVIVMEYMAGGSLAEVLGRAAARGRIIPADWAVDVARHILSALAYAHGRRVVHRDGNDEIYVMALDGSGQTRLTNNKADDSSPVFSPDGDKIAFFSERDGNCEIYVMNADGSSQTRLTYNDASDYDPAFAPMYVEGRLLDIYGQWHDIGE